MRAYPALITRVVDGDTVDAVVDLGFDLKWTKRIRLYGIDTPETRTSDADEKARGLRAKHALEERLRATQYRVELRVPTEAHVDKFGRVLGQLWQQRDRSIDGESDEPVDVNLNRWLIDHGYARSYFGQSKLDTATRSS